MASKKGYLDFILDQLSELDGVTYRAMMGEYILYYRGKVCGGVYDDRLLVKDTPAARALLPGAPLEAPYEGAKPMLLAPADDRALLTALLPAMYGELPAPRRRTGGKP